MSAVWHLARTDLRRHAPILALMLALHALLVVVVESVSLWAGGDEHAGALSLLASLAAVGELITFAVTVSVVVHGDPLVGARAFWLTRPIAPVALFAAKLLVLGAALVVFPVIVNGARLAAYGAPAEAIAAASLQLTLTRSAWLAAAWLFAAVTASTASFVLAIVGSGAAALALFVIIMTIATLVSRGGSDGGHVEAPPFPDETGAYLGAAMLAGLGLVAISRLYALRRWPIGAAIGVGIALAAGAARLFTPWSLAGSPPPQPPAWFEDAARHRIALDPPRLRVMSRDLTARPEPVAYLAARFVMSGLPRGYSAICHARQSQLVPAGAHALSGGSWRNDPTSEQRVAMIRAAEVTADLGEYITAEQRPIDPHVEGTIQRIPARQLAVLSATPLRLEATLEWRLFRHRQRARLPLRQGASVRDERGDLLEVAHSALTRNGATVLLRRTRFPSFRTAPASEELLALHDAAHNQWSQALAVARRRIGAPTGFDLELPSDGGQFARPWANEWQTLSALELRGPESGDREAWLRRLSLVVLESRYAGRVIRQWSQDGVSLAGDGSK